MAVDFAALKRQVSIEQVIDRLGLELKRSGDTSRGCCPICDGDNPRAFVVTHSKQFWYSFCTNCQKGGDLIELVAAVEKVSVKDAGPWFTSGLPKNHPTL